MMLIQHILKTASRRLAIVAPQATVRDVAKLLVNTHIPIVIVCDSSGAALGVVSRTDIIKVLAEADAGALDASATTIMTSSMQSCHIDETLQSVWETLGTRSLRCVPILDDSRVPRGVAHARDVARGLLGEVEDEEQLLRNYVLGVGYQ